MTDALARSPVCAVVGVGPGNGTAFVRRLAGQQLGLPFGEPPRRAPLTLRAMPIAPR